MCVLFWGRLPVGLEPRVPGQTEQDPFPGRALSGCICAHSVVSHVRAEQDEPLSTTSPTLSGFPVVPSTSSCYHFSSWSLWKQGYFCPGSSFEVVPVHSRWPPKSWALKLPLFPFPGLWEQFPSASFSAPAPFPRFSAPSTSAPSTCCLYS